MARNKRRTKKNMRPYIINPRRRNPEKPKPIHEMTEEQLQSRIYELEYRRATLPKYPNVRIVLAEERITQEINILRKKLETKLE